MVCCKNFDFKIPSVYEKIDKTPLGVTIRDSLYKYKILMQFILCFMKGHK